jgi:FdhE protein
MSIDQATRLRHLERKAEELASRDFLPADLVRLVTAVARRQLEALGQARVALPPPEEIAPEDENLAGKPLWPRERFHYDEDQAADLFHEFLALAQNAPAPLGKSAKTFGRDVLPELDLEEANRKFLAGEDDWFRAVSERTPDAPRLASFLVQACLTPSLVLLADSLIDRVPTDRAWRHGHCPVCGSQPLISSLREKEGKRFYTCSFCLSDYRAPRIACPFCGESDQKKLVFYDIPKSPGYRIDACESCRFYIKTADFRTLDKISVPALDDLESLHLDFLARDRNYSRPTLSAWGF